MIEQCYSAGANVSATLQYVWEKCANINELYNCYERTEQYYIQLNSPYMMVAEKKEKLSVNQTIKTR